MPLTVLMTRCPETGAPMPIPSGETTPLKKRESSPIGTRVLPTTMYAIGQTCDVLPDSIDTGPMVDETFGGTVADIFIELCEQPILLTSTVELEPKHDTSAPNVSTTGTEVRPAFLTSADVAYVGAGSAQAHCTTINRPKTTSAKTFESFISLIMKIPVCLRRQCSKRTTSFVSMVCM